MMIQLVSLALFGTVLVIAIAAIIASVKAEMPLILRALGAEQEPVAPLPAGERRIRVTRSSAVRPLSAMPYRAAA